MQAKHRIRLLPATLLAMLLSFWIPSPGQTAQESVAVVNDIHITRRDVAREAGIIAADAQLRNLAPAKKRIARFSNQLAETLIERELLFQRARQIGIEIRAQWIERALLDLKAKAQSASSFDTYLTGINFTEKQLKARIKKGLIIRRLLRREVLHRIRVSEAEMQAFFQKHPEFFIRRDQIRVRQIFIAAAGKGHISKRGKALLRIQSIQDRLRKGADFTSLALEYSEDPSKARGGDLGYLERKQLIPAFADAAFALQPGETSDIVETRLGYHLIKRVDHIPSSQVAYRNARTKIERTLRRNKEQAAVTAYLRKLKSQATITR